MARTLKREEAAFPSAPDPRFGGNLARANVGKQYSRAFPGGPPGVDRMYENYQAPHRVDYTSPRQRGTPAYEGTGRPSFEEWRPNINPRGMREMMGGLGGLESLQSKVNLQEIMDRMPWMNPYRIIKGLESHGVEYAENDPFDPSRLGTGDPFNNQIFTDPFDPRRLGIEEEPYDPFNPPGWTEPEPYDPFNNQLYAARGGLMSLRR
jgi:hypothetical protein